MIYLSGVCNANVLAAAERWPIGLMVQPLTRHEKYIPRVKWWAADNACFSQSSKFTMDGYLTWLTGLKDYNGTCLFATAPDVVGDAAATLERSRPVLPRIRDLGFRVAFVAQDGLAGIPWDEFDALFIGGTTRFKFSPPAIAAVREARTRGKWVHMGRVNSRARVINADRVGCDSVDGTFLRPAPDENLPRMVSWLRTLETQLVIV